MSSLFSYFGLLAPAEYNIVICGSLALALGFLYPRFSKQPLSYGRYATGNSDVGAKKAWFLLNLPALLVVCTSFISNYGTLTHYKELHLQAFLIVLYLSQLIYRGCVYPLMISKYSSGVPFDMLVVGMFFQAWMTHAITQYLCDVMEGPLITEFLRSPIRVFGMILFITGFFINFDSDWRLTHLKRPHGLIPYSIPYGGVFDFVSAGNYFGEILKWWGFFFACFGIPAFLNAVFMTSVLGYRGYHHHQWYLKHFKLNYPKTREAVFFHLLKSSKIRRI